MSFWPHTPIYDKNLNIEYFLLQSQALDFQLFSDCKIAQIELLYSCEFLEGPLWIFFAVENLISYFMTFLKGIKHLHKQYYNAQLTQWGIWWGMLLLLPEKIWYLLRRRRFDYFRSVRFAHCNSRVFLKKNWLWKRQ